MTTQQQNHMLQHSIAFYTIVRREIKRFFRIWTQTILPSAITMMLYFVIFGNLIGAQIAPIHNFNFMQYIAPGLIMMAVVTNSYANVVGSFFGARFQRYIDEILVAPVPNYLILSGYVIGGVLRGMIVALVITAIALFFTQFQIHNLWFTIVVVILAAVLFSLAGFCNAVFAKKFDDISIVPTFVLTPLTYFGGVFYSTSMLSPFWQKLSLLNPILYIVNAFRYGLLGISDVNIYVSVTMVVFLIVLLWLFCLYLLNRGIGLKA
jgi:ABC-2 type transport system permease protein